MYVDGLRTDNPENLDETYEVMHERGGMAWTGLYRPGPTEIQSVAQEFGLHELAVEDAMHGHQRSKLERYEDTLFTVLRPAWYLDGVEKVEFGQLHVFVGPDFVVTIRHAESPNLTRVRQRLESSPEAADSSRRSAVRASFPSPRTSVRQLSPKVLKLLLILMLPEPWA